MIRVRDAGGAYRASGRDDRAKLFANGRSQAVRLPKAYRLPGTEVLIWKEGDRVILEPLPAQRLDPDACVAVLDRIAATCRPAGPGSDLAGILAEIREER